MGLDTSARIDKFDDKLNYHINKQIHILKPQRPTSTNRYLISHLATKFNVKTLNQAKKTIRPTILPRRSTCLDYRFDVEALRKSGRLEQTSAVQADDHAGYPRPPRKAYPSQPGNCP